MMSLMPNMKNTYNLKCDVNVKIKNIRIRLFRVSAFDVYFTNFLNKVACKLKKSQPNLASKSDTATKTCPMLKRTHLISRLDANV